MKTIALAVALVLLLLTHASIAEEPAAERPKLSRGINLSHWFAQNSDLSPTALHKRFDADDAQLIHSLGLDHVRFTLDPSPLWDYRHAADPAKLSESYLREIDAALDMLLSAGLDVIVDLHPEQDFKDKLASDPAFTDAAATFWSALARHLAGRDPRRVALEVINEPNVPDPKMWHGIATRLVTAIRVGAPRHLIIVTGPGWSGIDDLLKMEPVADKHVLYTFHFYEPMDFTHQGASWGAPYWAHLKGVPYPMTTERVKAMSASIANDEARRNVEWNSRTNWDAAQIAKRIGAASDWATKRNVGLYCGEFGAYRSFAPATDRAEWVHDVRSALDHAGIGWAMWDYSGGFALVQRNDRTRTADPVIVKGLGLTIAASPVK